MKLRELEKSNIEVKLFFKKGPEIKLPIPKKIPKQSGKKISAMGIKNLKLASKVKEYEIQKVPAKKTPTPKK